MSLSQEAVNAFMNIGAKTVFDEPMKKHTTFKTGGNADVFILPENEEQISEAADVCRRFEIPYFTVGNGSNLLVSDKGIRGAVIHIGKAMSNVRTDGERIYAGAGALLSSVASAALKSSLSGFEALSGIPGSVGGAVYMNAGAYGAQISDVLVSSSYAGADGVCGTYERKMHNFGYRKSVYMGADKIITGAVFELKRGSSDEIRSLMADYTEKRRSKQPISFPSAGSVFKRPEGHFAGALIEQAGLKGFAIGGAQVSELHAGFIINTGKASSDDVRRVIEHIKETVYADSGVMLECEIKMLGEF